MSETVKNFARLAVIATVVGGGLSQIMIDINNERERAIDIRCGGQDRPNCTRRETKALVPHFDGTVGSTTIVEFIPNSTPTLEPLNQGLPK